MEALNIAERNIAHRRRPLMIHPDFATVSYFVVYHFSRTLIS
jgi:hypothetical protein